MDTNTFLDATATKIVLSILSLLWAGLLTWWKKKGNPWTAPLLYGLGGFALMMACLIGLQWFIRPAPVIPQPVTTANVEEHVIAWLDNFGLSVKNEPGNDFIFRRVATLSNGNKVIIARQKSRDRYLTIHTVLQTGADEKALWDKLSGPQLDDIVRQVTIEAARSKTTFTRTAIRPFSMILEKRLPITSELSEALLIQQVDDLDSTVVLLQSIVGNSFRSYGFVK